MRFTRMMGLPLLVFFPLLLAATDIAPAPSGGKPRSAAAGTGKASGGKHDLRKVCWGMDVAQVRKSEMPRTPRMSPGISCSTGIQFFRKRP